MGWLTCAQCKERFGLTDEVEAQLRRSSASFVCPWGHSLSFPQGPSEQERLRQENNRLKQREAYLADRRREAEEKAERERRRALGYKGHAAKLAKRAKAGVCPCCNRTVGALARHMATEHPDFDPAAIPEEVG